MKTVEFYGIKYQVPEWAKFIVNDEGFITCYEFGPQQDDEGNYYQLTGKVQVLEYQEPVMEIK